MVEREALQLTGWLANDVDGDPEVIAALGGDIRSDLCLCCGELRRLDVCDPCLGTLPGVTGACCGHGRLGWYVYVDVVGLGRLEGPTAARVMRELGGHPPARAFQLDPIGLGS